MRNVSDAELYKGEECENGDANPYDLEMTYVLKVTVKTYLTTKRKMTDLGETVTL